MAIKSISFREEFPAGINRFNQGDKYHEFVEYLNLLEIDGETLCLEIEDEIERRNHQAYCHHIAGQQKSKLRGWGFQTVTDGAKLYIRKVKRISR